MKRALLAVALCGCVSRLGGAFEHQPEAFASGASVAAQELLTSALADLDPARRTDYHTHLVGLGAGGTGAFVHPHSRAWLLHPLRYLTFSIYASAAGVDDFDDADAQFVDRLARLARSGPGRARHLLLPFDKAHDRQGTPLLEHTEFYTPNDYVFAVARRHPDVFVPAISVNPYRADALAELTRWAQAGGKVLKWLPNAMQIDPADERLVPFYERMREHGVALLTHAGEERAVEADEAQELGNPLRLRLPLAHGVKVIVAHCASLGEGVDLEDPARRRLRNLTLFLRLMDEPAYVGLLFGEISALTLHTRYAEGLPAILARPDLHPRLVDGSDYPLPAINVVLQTRELEDAGFITDTERLLLNEIYDYNPLLFDLAVKRTVRGPDGERFAASIFHEHPALPIR
jgi:uncharacterized protein